MPDIIYTFDDAPSLRAFYEDDSFINAVTGPYGSGKSSACVMKILNYAMRQKPGPDGIRKSKWGVVRNTYPELLSTTIETFHHWVPPEGFGHYVKSGTPSYLIDRLNTADGIPVEIDIQFRALDKPQSVRDLLSLEYTGAWFNELREMPRIIFEHMIGRVGRYPATGGGFGPTWHGIIGDTNPPDTDHWFYKFFEEEKPIKCATCKTENGEMVLYTTKTIHGRIIPIPERVCPMCGADHTKSIPLTKIYHQPSGRSQQAENRKHLGKDYYSSMMITGTPEFIKVYVDGEYGYVGEGRPVYGNWSSAIHQTQERIQVIRHIPLIIGLDYGLNPAAILCQAPQNGILNVVAELMGEDMVFRQFVNSVLKPYINANYPGMELIITGDPSGVRRSEADGNTCFRELKAAGMPGVPAPSNSIQARLGAVNNFLTKMIPNDSKKPGDLPFKAGLQVSGPTCPVLIRGFNGAYRRKRIPIVGKEMYRDEPEKTPESHPHDALQYAALLVDTGAFKVRKSIYHSHVQEQAPPVGAYT